LGLKEHKAEWATHLLWFLWLVLMFAPILGAWYYHDDMQSYIGPYLARFTNRPLPVYFWRLNRDFYMNAVGRFYPANVLLNLSFFSIFRGISGYRFGFFLGNLSAVVSFAWMVRVYTRSKRFYYAVLLLYPALFLWLTVGDDPITSYYTSMQFLVILFSASLILWRRHLQMGGKRYLTAALALYVLALLTYELSYPLLLIFPLACWFLSGDGPWKPRLLVSIQKSWPFAAAAAVCFAIYIYVSQASQQIYAGTSFSFDPSAILETSAKQFAAAFPLAPQLRAFLDGEPALALLVRLFSQVRITDIMAALGFAALAWYCLFAWEKQPASPSGKGFLWSAAACLVVFPCLLVGASVKYQETLYWGVGYLPAYLTRFALLLGTALLLFWVLAKLKRAWLRVAVQGTFLALACVLLVLSMVSNRAVVERKNWHVPGHTLYMRAVDNGVLEPVAPNGVVVLQNRWYFGIGNAHGSALLSHRAGQEVRVYFRVNGGIDYALSLSPVFVSDYRVLGRGDGASGFGYAYSAAILEYDRTAGEPALVRDMALYSYGPYSILTADTLLPCGSVETVDYNLTELAAPFDRHARIEGPVDPRTIRLR
jgi:hypothetical protein